MVTPSLCRRNLGRLVPRERGCPRRLRVGRAHRSYRLALHLVSTDGTGPYSHIGTCDSPHQTGCVVAYNAYAQTPPADALFGRPGTAAEAAAGDTVVCTNPAALAAGTGRWSPSTG